MRDEAVRTVPVWYSSTIRSRSVKAWRNVASVPFQIKRRVAESGLLTAPVAIPTRVRCNT